jgi:hypothetical protein
VACFVRNMAKRDDVPLIVHKAPCVVVMLFLGISEPRSCFIEVGALLIGANGGAPRLAAES